MILKESYKTPSDFNQKIRVSDYLHTVLKSIQSRKGIKKALQKELITVNGKTAFSYLWVQANDKFCIHEKEWHPNAIFELDLEVLFEDEHLAVIYKPAGYPTSGNFYKTIVNALSYNLKQSSLIDAFSCPQPVHRLDASTQGILICAKTRSAAKHLGNQFEIKKIQKEYTAIIQGKIDQPIRLLKEIDDKPSCSRILPLKTISSKYSKSLTLVKLIPETGRTHQLRKHLAFLNHPILGDTLYTTPEFNLLKHKGLYLVASKIKFEHPYFSNKIIIEINLPSKFKRYFNSAS